VASRSSALAVGWSGGGSGEVVVSVSASAGSATTVATCSFDSASGSGSVPSDVLSRLPPTGGGVTGALSVYSRAQVNRDLDGWALTLSLIATARTPGGVATAQLELK
jgi:hypothetical protein